MKTKETFAEEVKRALIAVQNITIPNIPEDIIALDQEFKARYPNNLNIVEIISKNTMLAAELLRIANLPMMHQKNPITSISHAVSVLGTDILKNMLLSAGLKQVFGDTTELREMMEDSADVAVCASELAQHVQGVTPDEAYTCGLFHNCGSILLMIKDPEHYHDLFFKSYTFPLKAIEKEEEIFGTNHTVTGLVLANKWDLDKNIISAIYQHHIVHCIDIENEKTRLLVALLKVANGIVAEVSLGAYISKEMKDYMQDGVNTLMLEYNHLVDARLALHNYRIGL